MRLTDDTTLIGYNSVNIVLGKMVREKALYCEQWMPPCPDIPRASDTLHPNEGDNLFIKVISKQIKLMILTG